ncbi:MAG TPA: uroporphyrinogen-III C-methyltransferase [Kiloniellales bacterium]|nr:uroporphyrinogen-III C-methyltransferase [Kiloniellales bacterium]
MTSLESLLAALPQLEPGMVWLAGAGPGDPRCLTLETLSALRQAEVIVHDALVDGRVLALASPGAELILAGKRGGKPSWDQGAITATLIARARAGRRVLRLKGGDPFIFGRGGEEIFGLAEARVPFRVLPGVTAGLAALAQHNLPATMRGINHAVVLATGHGAPGEPGPDWAALARLAQPLVLYMSLHKLEEIAKALVAGGLSPDTPAAAIQSTTLPEERLAIAPLAEIAAAAAAAGIEPPAIVVVGKIVAARERLAELLAADAARR